MRSQSSADGPIDSRATGARIVGERGEQTAGPGPEVMAASTLEGDRILSTDGEEVGKVKEIMLDVQGGRIAYVVMSSGGFLGIGDKLLAIPWNALTLDTTRKCFLLSLSSERVKNAPGFDKDRWPSMADRTWATSLHQYYGREPYWHGLGADDEYERGPRVAAEDLDPDAPEAGGVKL
jgi:sporulation protein YlmC with PRC-barrel domain